MELQAFQQWIALTRQYSGDITSYQQQYSSDQQALHSAQSDAAYKNAMARLQGHVDAIKIPAMKIEGTALLQQLKQQVTAWGQTHQYHDTFNNITYPLGYEYGPNGVGGWAEQELGQSQTLADYQQTVEDLNVYLTNFQAMMTNAGDKTPYNQVHQTDLQLIQHYGFMNKKVVVVSLEEQALRVYDNGKLVNAFLVTSGRTTGTVGGGPFSASGNAAGSGGGSVSGTSCGGAFGCQTTLTKCVGSPGFQSAGQ